ncbi:MAG TPA: hypothetical protein VEV81_01400, partial [Pyrinomonadaceae bacterium]|nr:hypothetical protein [Pyrinomonadaceae bacterium]
SLAVRYQGQSFELEVEWTRGISISEAFHEAHRARYGYAQEANHVEVVSLRLRSTGMVEKSRTERAARSSNKRRTARPREFASVHFVEGRMRTGIYRREELEGRARLLAPCIVTEYSATTLVPPGASASVDEQGNLIIVP